VSSTWQGWEKELLKFLQLPTTAANVQFLRDWNARKHSDCNNNPIDLTYDSGNATNCQRSYRASHPWYQSYKRPGDAMAACSSQFIVVGYDALAAALQSGDPYGVDYFARVEKDLSRWGADGFAVWYYNEAQRQQTQLTAAHLHKGWAHLQHTFNRGMPKSLKHGHRAVEAGLRSIHRARKVRL